MTLDKTKAIADALGWGEWVEHLCVLDICSGNQGERSVNYITFAAYAKAAMAKRGMLPYYDERYGKYDHVLFHKGDIESGTKFHFFDPTDPISEANALIDAIYAALEMETTT